jgi:4-diphosphocytidyl-2-C-methyl-D-erythritol kinase
VKLSALAPGKVNLTLFVGPTRPVDGRHEVVTVIESVSLADELTMTAAHGGEDTVVCAGVDGPNIVSAALQALRDGGWDGPPVLVEIDKRVPVAAGMGGGSADAAAVFRLAAALAPLPPGLQIERTAAGLGADVPSQLAPGLTLGLGAGDEITALEPLAPHELVIVPVDAALGTAEVYREADRLSLPRTPAELERLRGGLASALAHAAGDRLPGGFLVNDLQRAAVSLCPPIVRALGALRAAGADHAFVSGSGPTVAGLYWAGGPGEVRAEGVASELRERGFERACAAVPVDAAFGAARDGAARPPGAAQSRDA